MTTTTTTTTPMPTTAPTSTSRLRLPLDEARRRFFDGLPAQFESNSLGSGVLRELQTRRIRRVLTSALGRSAFHRRRLAGVDPSSFTLDQLATLPPMTKHEMMADFDEVVTDPVVRLDEVNEHLRSLGETPVLFRDRYVVLASGGSSGTRGVFVTSLEEAAHQAAAVVRGGLAGMAATLGWPPPGPAPMTIVAAPTCVHATRMLSSVFLQGRLAEVTYAPVTDPFEVTLETVQAAQPLILIGYPSVIAQLAEAQSSGRLSIKPMVVSVTSEQLTGAQIDRITDSLGVAPTNSYGTSEGLMGSAPPGSDVFDFASDNVYVEFVDADDAPVETGQEADHILVTNLVNCTQPLIRYRIDDMMTPASPAPHHGHQRASIRGRNDEPIDIAGVLVHPLTIRSALLVDSSIGDYQVRLDARNAIDVDIVSTNGSTDLVGVEKRLACAVADAGARPVHIRARQVERLARDVHTGKVKRFVSVDTVAAPSPETTH